MEDLFLTVTKTITDFNICANVSQPCNNPNFTIFRIAICMAYYGFALNSSDLAGDLFLNFFLQAVIDIPAKLLNVFLLNRTGRKFLMVFSLLVGGVGFTATVFTSLLGKDGGKNKKTDSNSNSMTVCPQPFRLR